MTERSGLAGSDQAHLVDLVSVAATGQVIDGRGQALQDGAVSVGAGEALDQLVADVAGLEVGEDQDVGVAGNLGLRSLEVCHGLDERGVKLQVAVDSRRMGAHSWWVTLVCTVVCLVLGILLVFNPFDGKQVLTIMMGVSLIVDGVQNLCTVVYAAVFVKDVKNAVHDFVDDATAVETTGEVIGEDDAGSRPDDGPKAP